MKPKALFMVTALSLALLAAVAFSQEAEKELSPKPDVKALIQKLGSADFAERKKAEEEILAIGAKALPALREASKAHPDAHVRYEAERILHRIGLAMGKKEEKELAERPVRDPFAESERQMNELLRQLEERGMMDWEAFERWREHMRSRFSRDDSRGFRGGVISGVSDNGKERIEYEQAQDGSLKIRITSDGETQEFKAKSAGELKERHPQVFEKVAPLLGRVRIEWGAMPDPLLRRRMPGGLGIPRRPQAGVARPLSPQETFRMGVWTGEVSEPLRIHLKLQKGVGVLVEDVVPGSFAGQIGLETFDVIRMVQGQKVGSAGDIRKVIATVAAGEQVVLDIIRKGEPLKLMRNR